MLCYYNISIQGYAGRGEERVVEIHCDAVAKKTGSLQKENLTLQTQNLIIAAELQSIPCLM